MCGLGDDALVRTVTLIEAPTSAGAYAPGQEDGPRALLDAGLREELEAVGVTVRIGGQASTFRWRPDPGSPRAIDGAVDGLGALAAQRPMLDAGQISFLGLGPHTDFEAEVIADRELPVVDVRSTASDPLGSARTALAPLAACDSLAVHFDVDLVDFLDAPLAENTDRGTAPSLKACGEILSELLTDARVRALTVTEFNPHHGSKDGRATQRLLQVLIEVLGEAE